jgi:type I restriction enzyme S subunit
MFRTEYLVSLGTGATFKELSSGKLKEVTIPYPGIQEQRRIVKVLDEAFEAFANTKNSNQISSANTQSVFSTLLNNTFAKHSATWKRVELGSLGVTQTGSTPPTRDRTFYGNEVPFIKPGDFREDGSLNYQNEGLTRKGLAQTREIKAQSVLMVCIGTIGKCGLAEQDIAANQQINALTPNHGISSDFLYFQMLSDDFQRRVRLNAGQTTLPIINKSKWCRLEMLIPQTKAEQDKIAEKLRAIRHEVMTVRDIYAQKNNLLEEAKQALLQQAFSGQL